MTLCDFNKPASEILLLSWHENVLQFAAAARIIGKKNEGRDGHDLQDHDEKADGRSLCLHL